MVWNALEHPSVKVSGFSLDACFRSKLHMGLKFFRLDHVHRFDTEAHACYM